MFCRPTAARVGASPSPNAGVAEMRFSRADIATKSGMERWREVMGRAVLQLDLELLEGETFISDVRARALPGLRLAHARMAGLRMTRAPERSTDDAADLSLHIAGASTWNLTHRRARLALAPGSATLVANDEEAVVDCPLPTTSWCVQFSRRAIASSVRNIDDRVMRLHSQESESLRLLVDYVALLDARPALGTEEARGAVSAHIHDLLVLTLGASSDAEEEAKGRGLRAARLRRIEHDIRRQAHDPSLSIEAIAAAHRVSTRYIQLQFEAEGTTFTKYVLLRRLEAAHRALIDSRQSKRAISAIAFDAGFADVSYFNRAFRRQFGASPSEVRAGRR